MATKLCRVIKYCQKLPLIKIYNPLFTLPCEILQQIKDVLSNNAWSHQTYERGGVGSRASTNKVTWQFKQVIIWGHVCQIENTKSQLCNAYCHQTCQGDEIPRGVHIHKDTWPCGHMVLWFWFALLQLVDSESKRVCRHRLLVTFITILPT